VNLRYEASYPAPVEIALAIMTNDAFLAELAGEMHARSQEVTHVRQGDGLVTELVVTVPTEGIPSVFKRLVGSSLRIVDSRSWRPADPDGARRGVLAVGTSVRKYQLRVEGSTQLIPHGDGCLFTVSARVTAQLPIAAGLAAKEAHSLALEILADQSKLMNTWLADPNRKVEQAE